MSIEKFRETSKTTPDKSESEDNSEMLLADGNCGWRACYGPSIEGAVDIQQRDEQLRQDMENFVPEGNWHPDPSKLRDWDSPSDWWFCHSKDLRLCVQLPDGRVVDRYQPNNSENNYYRGR